MMVIKRVPLPGVHGRGAMLGHDPGDDVVPQGSLLTQHASYLLQAAPIGAGCGMQPMQRLQSAGKQWPQLCSVQHLLPTCYHVHVMVSTLCC